MSEGGQLQLGALGKGTKSGSPYPCRNGRQSSDVLHLDSPTRLETHLVSGLPLSLLDLEPRATARHPNVPLHVDATVPLLAAWLLEPFAPNT
jgi:hypothetical protein